MDNRLLENDFYFEAIDGLEQVPWQQSEKHLEETESRIIKEFSINKDRAAKKNLAWAGLGMFIASLLGIWYFAGSGPIDFTNETSTAPNEQELNDVHEEEFNNALEEEIKNEPQKNKSEVSPSPAILPEDSATIETPEKIPTTKPSPIVDRKKTQVNQTNDISNSADIHITVGRIVDTKGLAIPFAVVTSGSVSDTTDANGYFALKVAKGGVKLLVTHLGVPYQVEIDTNQNWQITLDVANKTFDYRPINAANRFK